MSTPGRRRGPRKGDLREQAILDTAWRLLAVKPASTITVDELAAGAELSRSSFYFYFDSRDAAITALAARTAGELRSAVSAGTGGDASPAGAVRAAVAGLLGRWREHGPVLRAMDAAAGHDPELRAFWAGIAEPLIDDMAAGIEAARASGQALPAPPDAHDLARALTDMYWRAGRHASLDPPTPEAEQRLIDTLTVITLRAIYGADRVAG